MGVPPAAAEGERAVFARPFHLHGDRTRRRPSLLSPHCLAAGRALTPPGGGKGEKRAAAAPSFPACGRACNVFAPVNIHSVVVASFVATAVAGRRTAFPGGGGGGDDDDCGGRHA